MPLALLAQPQALLIDKVVAVVGREAVLRSDMLAKVEQARQAGAPSAGLECAMLDELLYEKLLVEQGRLDSVNVDDAQVNSELDRRIRYFAQQIGGERKLEEYYGKSIAEIKDDFRKQVQDQLLMQQVQQRITSEVSLTPRDVKRFFERIPEDSVPYVGTEVEFATILRDPKANEEEVRRVRRKMEEFREAVVKKEKDFCVLAMSYSEDPGSAQNCGELGMVPPGVMVPEFDAVAMSLKDGEVSNVFSTQFGWHFMQMVERRGEQYNARHVLMIPKVSPSDLLKERDRLDSVRTAVLAGTLDFGEAALALSDDEDSKGNRGLMVEPSTNSTRWDLKALDQQTFFVLDRLKPGEVSEPQVLINQDNSKSYRLLKLINRTEPHRANLRDDYRLIHQAAEASKRQQAVDKWVADRSASTYVRIDQTYRECPFNYPWNPPET
ncbi:MAG TPA: peptidylprolyl isomerase, partial [Flavobacteriales bacterium]|nr:peptidylprolyl isomerase [Flavobacteriales bacterium]